MAAHLFDSQNFMPHGHCYLWRADILWLNVISDGLIAISYYAIPAALVYLVSKRKDLEFDWIFIMFALFILACGTTHVMEIITVWSPQYATEGLVKLFTAGVSVTTAISLIPLMPKALAVPSFRELEESSEQLSELNNKLKESNALLEKRVEEKTRDISQLAAIVMSSNDTIIGEDVEGRITSWNPSASELFGFSEQEALGKSIYDLVPPDHLSEVQRVMKNLQHGDDPGVVDNVRLAKDGKPIDVSLRFSPMKDSQGKLIGSSAIVRDITARKRNERRIQQSELRFRQVIEAAPNGLLMVNEEDRIVLCNAEIEKIFGYPKSELIGKNFELLIPERFRGSTVSWKKKFDQQLYGRRKDGSEVPIDLGLNPLETDEGSFVLASVTDVSKRKLMEDRIRHSVEAIQQKNQEMEQFVYTVSHDLKSPLVTSSGFLGLLKEDIEAGRYDDVMDSVQRLQNANNRMAQLIDDLLQLSRVGRVKVEIEKVNVRNVVRDICANLAAQINEKGFQIQIQEDIPEIKADRKRVYQIFENLIINALKYASHVPAPKLEIGGKENGTEILFFVKDNGPGIAKEYHLKIFGLFQRLENDNQGTGVGLAIVVRAMQMHGGRVWVDSEPGHGATFWLAFPKNPNATGEDYDS